MSESYGKVIWLKEKVIPNEPLTQFEEWWFDSMAKSLEQTIIKMEIKIQDDINERILDSGCNQPK